MADSGPAHEDAADIKIQDVKKALQNLSCVSTKSEDVEVYGSKEPEMRDIPLPKAHHLPTFVQDDAVKVLTDEAKDLKVDDPFQYNMHHKKRGRFVLFNVAEFKSGYSPRLGSDVDAQLLEATFTKMDFEVKRFDNPKASDMVKELEKVASSDHSNMDCVAVGILTHGDTDLYSRTTHNGTVDKVIADSVLATDRSVRFGDLTDPFRATKCHETLKGKPKLFFIQACRGLKPVEQAKYVDAKKLPGGNASQQGNTSSDSSGEASMGERSKQTATEVGSSTSNDVADPGYSEESCTDGLSDQPITRPSDGPIDREALSLPENMPIYKDYLVAWSTAPGYISFRNETDGSIFIRTLCHCLDEFHATADLLSILTWCNSRIAHEFQSKSKSKSMDHRKQMPWFFSRLTKEIVFTPKPKPPSIVQ